MEPEPDAVRQRVVYDCMIFLQGAARPQGPSCACLKLAEEGLVELHVSEEILAEVGDVLTRPKVRAKFPALTDGVVQDFLARIRQFATLHAVVPRYFLFDRDPKDEPYLNLACHVDAHYLVSRDQDILDIHAKSPEIATPLALRHPGLQIINPLTFLLAVRSAG